MELNLLNLLFVLLAAWLSGSFAARLGYPSVLGELLAGVILGPPLLGLLHGSEALAVLADVGALLMMLYIGMEIDPREVGRASWPGLLAALGGFITPFVLAYLVVLAFGETHLVGLFVGIAAGVTSLAAKSRVVVDLKLLDTRMAHVLMAGALVSGTLALVAFAAVVGVVDAGSLDVAGIALATLKALAFFAVTGTVGWKVIPFLGRRLAASRLSSRTFHFTLVLLIAVSFGELAELAGLHSILGVFLAGLFIRDHVLGPTLAHDLKGAVRDASIGFLAPIFFVTAGFAVSFSAVRADLLLAVIGVAMVGKILGTALFYLPTGFGWREGIAIGAGMNGRGAVEIIIAAIGLEMGLISQEIFSVLVFMAIFTTATVLLLLKRSAEWLRRRGELVPSSDERRGTLVIGAGPLARALAHVLGRTRPVWLVDSNPERCAYAESEGLQITRGSALQEHVLSQAKAAHADSVIALTSNREVNTLSVQLARDVFEVPNLYVFHGESGGSGHQAALKHLSASRLFAGPIQQSEWDHWISHDEVARTKVAVRDYGTRDPAMLFSRLQRERPSLPLAIKRDGEYLPFHQGSDLTKRDELILLFPRPREEALNVPRDRFDRLASHCPVLDLERGMPLEEFFRLAAATFHDQAVVDPNELTEALLNREATTSTVIAPGLAVPHMLIGGRGRFHMLMARCREGIHFPGEPDDVHALFLLLRSNDERTFHLRALSAIAQIVQDSAFEDKWLTAWGPEELRRIVLDADRRRYPELMNALQ